MNQNLKNQTSHLPEIGAIILLLAAVGYYFYSSGGSASSSTSFTVSTATTSVGTSVLNLLNQIHSLNINTSLFSSPSYQSLTDFTVAIPPENIGKANPFLPPGTSGSSAPISVGSSTSFGSSSPASQ